jgi:hypothetical protein
MARKKAEDKPDGLVAARARLDIPLLGVKCGELVETDAATMAGLVADGSADPHPEAVAYARSLKQ